MGVIKHFLIATLFVSFLLPFNAHAGNKEEVLDALQRLIKLEREFDTATFDFYEDESQLYITRIYPGGIKKDLHLSFGDVKETFIKAMPLAKAKNDYKTYSDIKAVDNDGIVIVTGEAYSHYKNYKAPFKSVWIKDKNGEWKIFEEHIISKAF